MHVCSALFPHQDSIPFLKKWVEKFLPEVTPPSLEQIAFINQTAENTGKNCIRKIIWTNKPKAQK